MLLTREQEFKIAAESGADPRTVRRIYAGGTSKPSVRKSVTDAAQKLEIPAPPKEKKA